MSVELAVSLIAITLALGASAWSVLRPNWNGERIKELRSDFDELQEKLEDLQGKYTVVVTETLRLTGENIWLRNIILKAGIDIPPLPDYLRPHLDKNGNITLTINSDRNSVTVGDNTTVGSAAAGKDIGQNKP